MCSPDGKVRNLVKVPSNAEQYLAIESAWLDKCMRRPLGAVQYYNMGKIVKVNEVELQGKRLSSQVEQMKIEVVGIIQEVYRK